MPDFLKWFQKPLEKIADNSKAIALHKDYNLTTPEVKINYRPEIDRLVLSESIEGKDDFINYVQEFKTKQTKIFFNDNMVKSIFNYSEKTKADHHDSKTIMHLINTSEYTKFYNMLDENMSQKQFILFLKQLEPFIIKFDRKKIDDMDIVEIAESLTAAKNITSVQRNTSNAFVIDTEIKSGMSSAAIPKYMTLSMPLFKNDIITKVEFEVELFIDVTEQGFSATIMCHQLEAVILGATRSLVDGVCKTCKVSSYRVP